MSSSLPLLLSSHHPEASFHSVGRAPANGYGRSFEIVLPPPSLLPTHHHAIRGGGRRGIEGGGASFSTPAGENLSRLPFLLLTFVFVVPAAQPKIPSSFPLKKRGLVRNFAPDPSPPLACFSFSPLSFLPSLFFFSFLTFRW